MLKTIYTSAIRGQARTLRQQGYTYTEICAELGRAIPQATLAYWFKDIHLTPQQDARIRAKIAASAAQGRLLACKAWANKIARWREQIEARVQPFGRLASIDPVIAKLVCGIMYSCEGGKYPSSRQVMFGNTEPRMVRAFVTLLRRCYHIDERKWRVRVMHRWDQDGLALAHYWSTITQIPLAQFYRSYADKRTKGTPTRKRDYKGVCGIQYGNTEIQYELQAIGEAVLNGIASLPNDGGRKNGGAEGDRTPDLLRATQALSRAELLPHVVDRWT